MRLPIWLKSSIMRHFLAFSSHSRFCVNDYIAKMYREIVCNISSDRYGFSLQVIQQFFLNFQIFLTHKVPLK